MNDNRDKLFKLCGLKPKPLNENVDTDVTSSEKSDIIDGGMADNKSVVDFNPDQILKGLKVEMEHTKDPRIALEIAMDHLTENPEYYTYLENMESEFEKGDKNDISDSIAISELTTLLKQPLKVEFNSPQE